MVGWSNPGALRPSIGLRGSAPWVRRTLDRLLPAELEAHDPSRSRILVGSSTLLSLLGTPYIGLFWFGFGAPLCAGSLSADKLGAVAESLKFVS